MGELGRLGNTEVRFYSQLAPELAGSPGGLRGGIRHVDRSVPAGPGRPSRVVRISRHACTRCPPIRPASSSSYWRTCTEPSGTACAKRARAAGWLYTPSGDVTSLLTGSLMTTSMKRLAERTTIPVETRSIHRRELPRGRRGDRHSPAHGHARRRSSGQHVLPRRRAGTVGLAGGAPRTSFPRTGLHPDHQPHTGRPPYRRSASCSTSTGGAGRDRWTRPGPRRPMVAVPARRALRVCRPADHRGNGRNAGRRHRHGRLTTRRRRSR